MKRVRNIVVIVLSVICVGILAFLLWNLGSTEESAQEIIPEVQPEPMSEQSVSDSDVSGNSAENSGDPTELPETEESEPAEPVDLVEQKAEELLAGMTLEEKVGQMFIARCPETDAEGDAVSGILPEEAGLSYRGDPSVLCQWLGQRQGLSATWF